MTIIRKARLNDIDILINLENELYNNQIEYIRKSNPQKLDDFSLKIGSNKFLKKFILRMIH
jgi:hypothetical protein